MMSKISKRPKVGDELVTMCGKCKAEMYHVVVSVKEDEIKKVMCKGCNTTHIFRAAKPEKASAKKTKSAATTTKRVRRRSRKYDWGALQSQVEENEIIDYKLTVDLSEVKGIRHKSFGLGFITKVISDTQVEVLFEDSTKILVHNYTQ